eukprot:TRINITY_DN2859_c0_g2_i4.p1 TRINITY_DN2859_c0_g2~~TRINITY_DN2859_c0_g2_i4.p1  ORF type:complete len:633 (-),score=124.84 TRINITY_DN2859_c0_g2_i4:374-2236(-)
MGAFWSSTAAPAEPAADPVAVAGTKRKREMEDLAPSPKRARVDTSAVPPAPAAGPLAAAAAAVATAPETVPDLNPIEESDVGITEFLGTAEPFQGVLKERFSDFLVHEIALDGTVVRLTEPLSSPDALNAAFAPMLASPERLELRKGERPVVPPLIRESLDAALGASGTEALIEFVSNYSVEAVALDPTRAFLLLPAPDDKQKRGQIHQAIRNHCHPALSADTVPLPTDEPFEKQQFAIRITFGPGDLTRWRPRVGVPAADASGPHVDVNAMISSLAVDSKRKYLRLVLYKENRDTTEAVAILARSLGNLGVKRIDWAGTKDKRAVTTQYVTIFRGAEVLSRLLAAAPTLAQMRIRVGNIAFVEAPLKLGQLRGNRFSLVLRRITAPVEVVAKSVATLEQQGFINYYGLQRFGTGVVRTHQVGRELLLSQWKQAVTLILQSYQLRSDRATGTARPRGPHKRDSIEDRIERHLRAKPNDYLGALGTLARNSLLMYVHAFQSFVWNTAASLRIQLSQTHVVAGDLVLLGVEDTEIPDVIQDGEALEDVPTGALGAQAAGGENTMPRVHVVQAGEESRYTLADVVLPLPGYDVVYPNNAVGESYHAELAKYGLSVSSFRHSNR